MPAEIVFPFPTTGLATLTARLRTGATVVGSAIALSDAASAGIYLGDIPGGTADGNYDVVVYQGSTVLGASPRPLHWRSGVEAFAALPGAAMTLTPGERTTLAAQIEAALLADGDGQAFVNAIVAAIGNVNVNQAVLIAAIRADLERAGGLLDVLPTLTEIEASAILAKAAQVPTAAAVATAVRTNLATELGRMDVAVSTRESEASAASRAATDQAEHDATQVAVAAIAAIGDPLTRPVPGTYPAGSAGEALGRLVVPGSPEDPVIVIPAPPNDVSTCRVYGYVEGPDNRRIVNAKVKVVLLPRDTAVASNRLIAGREVQLSTNSEGRIMGPTGDPWVDLQRNDLLLPAGSFYEVTSAELGVSRKQVTLTTSLADLRALLLAA